VSKRDQNERDYPEWEELPDGGRRYWKVVKGKIKNTAHYIKVVDSDEAIVLFVQEIYDNEGRLIARHQKYPEDTGHQEIVNDGDD
jgi:hypothetical protein